MKTFYLDHENGRNSLSIWILCSLTFLICFWAILHLSPVNILETLFSGGPGTKITRFIYDLYLPDLFWTYFRPTIFLLIALWIAQKKLRRRPFTRLINGLPHTRFRWKRLLAAIVVYIGLAVISWGMVYIFTNVLARPSLGEQLGPITEQFKPVYTNHPYTKWVLILAPLITFNALVQELLFRGFIDQGLSRMLAEPIAVFTLSGLIYAMSYISFPLLQTHIYSGEWSVLFVYTLNLLVYGVFLSAITYLDNGIEAAVGLSLAGTLYVESFNLPYFEFLDPGVSSSLSYEMVNLLDTITFYFLALVILTYWRFGTEEETSPENV